MTDGAGSQPDRQPQLGTCDLHFFPHAKNGPRHAHTCRNWTPLEPVVAAPAESPAPPFTWPNGTTASAPPVYITAHGYTWKLQRPSDSAASPEPPKDADLAWRVWRVKTPQRESPDAYTAFVAGFNVGAAASTQPATTDDPVRRDREGWEAGVKACIDRLQEEAESWEQESRYNDITPGERNFVEKRIGQIKTHIAQLSELKYNGAFLQTAGAASSSSETAGGKNDKA